LATWNSRSAKTKPSGRDDQEVEAPPSHRLARRGVIVGGSAVVTASLAGGVLLLDRGVGYPKQMRIHAFRPDH